MDCECKTKEQQFQVSILSFFFLIALLGLLLLCQFGQKRFRRRPEHSMKVLQQAYIVYVSGKGSRVVDQHMRDASLILRYHSHQLLYRTEI